MIKPNEIKLLTNIVKLCCGITGCVAVFMLLKLAIILEG